MYITMYSSDPEIAAKVEIPSVYVTMADGEMLVVAGQMDLDVSLEVSLALFLSLKQQSAA